MATVNFKPQIEFAELAADVFEKEKSKLSKIVPEADIQHIGSTAIINSLTKGDLDIQVRVEESEFPAAVKELKKLYEINQPEKWTENYASFKDEKREMPIGVQLTVRGSEDDELFQGQQKLLSSNPEVLEEYNKMKLSFEGKDISEYRAAREKFFEKLKANDE